MGRTDALQLETARLTLVPFRRELVAALPDHERLSSLLRATIPAGWPDEQLAGILPRHAASVEADRSVLGYGPWIAVAREERVVVGSAGFLGRPDASGTVELGYGTHHARRRLGYASEAAGALVAWAFDGGEVERIVARCEPANRASIRVLEKVGFTPVGEAEGALIWEMLASALTPRGAGSAPPASRPSAPEEG